MTGPTVELPSAEGAGGEPPSFRPGTVIGGKFRIDRTIAEGGMGTVVAAYHLVLEQPVALKFLRADEGADWKSLLELFKREAKAAARLKSEHVARVLDVAVTDDGLPYMVMEYLEGQSMDRVLKERGALPIASAVEYAIQACECLAEAHAHGIVHRDVKPPNLFLVERAPGLRSIKVLDFGISKFTLSEVALHANNVIIGTLCYMSPEQIRSSASVDHRADIWSLGATLYEMLSGRAPFDSSAELLELVDAIMFKPPVPLRELRPDVPEQLAAVISRCLSKNAGARFDSAGELAMALLPFASPSLRPLAEQAASMRPIVKAQRSTAGSPTEMTVYEPPLAPARSETKAASPIRPPFVPRGLVIAATAAAAVCVVTFSSAALISTYRRAHVLPAAEAPPVVEARRASTPLSLVAGPEMKDLLVRATPSSARISIDGVPVQANPFAGRYPKDGVHTVEATSSGYEPRRERVTLTGDAVLDVTLERQPIVATVTGKRSSSSSSTSGGSVKQRSGRSSLKSERAMAQPDRDFAIAPIPAATTRRLLEVDPAGGQQPLRPIEVRNPYGDL